MTSASRFKRIEMGRLNIGNLVRVTVLPYEFADDFETGWFVSNPFTSIFTESFETGWFTDNPFITLLFTDNFENGWFIDNAFTNLLFTEDFEDGGWE